MSDADYCPRCGAVRPANAPKGLCPRCLTRQAPAGDTHVPGAGASEGGVDVTDSDRSPEPTEADSEATGAYIPGSVATVRTIDPGQTLGRTDSQAIVDGPVVSRDLPRGTAVRYFGDYEILNELGRGGMGVVYKARQVSLNRLVALKMIKAGVLADHADLQRFQNEAEAVALLDHAGIVPVYEVGEHDGQRYFSMKLVEGGNLAERLATFKDHPRAAATFLAGMAEAVHHAHMRGILHRDLKPANILIDAEGHPHITDFGLAKRVGGDIEMTQSGAILGTPSYMSPEQAAGRRGSITTATDVYGLGAILYALLAGRAPFGCDSVIETLDAVRARPPESPKKFNAHVPRDLETICLKCLEKDPRRRYASAHELGADLRNWLDSRPITARRVGSTERAWLWCRRRPAIATLAASIVLAAVVGTAAVIAVQTRANRLLEKKNLELRASNAKLEQQRVRAEDREARAIDAVKRFRDAVAGESVLRNNPEFDDLRKRLLKEPLAFFRSLRDRLQADHDTRPDSLARLARASFDLGHLTEEIGDKQDALIAHRESLAIRRKLADADPTATRFQNDLASSYSNIGNLLKDTGKPADAMAAYGAAQEILRKLAVADPADTKSRIDLASSQNNLGVLLRATGKRAEARTAYESALAIQKKLADADPAATKFSIDLAASYHNLGVLLIDDDKPAEAMSAYESALAIRRRLADANPAVTKFQSDLASSHNNIGILLRGAGKPAEAMKSYESALAIRRKLADANPTVSKIQSDLAGSYNNIGRVLINTRKPAEAMKAYESALTIQKKLADANPAAIQFQNSLAGSYRNIGNLLSRIGKPSEAMSAYESALVIGQRLAREHPESPEFASDLGATLHGMAGSNLNANRFQEARDRFHQAIAWQKKALAVNPSNPTYREFLEYDLLDLIQAARGLGDSEGVTQAERELAKLRDSSPAMMALDARLSAVLKGIVPETNAERLALAQRAHDKSLFAAAARLFAESFAADPKLADDRQAQHPYNAACAASLAASGQGKDAPQPDDAAKTKLRRLALDWLAAEVSAWKRVSTIVEPGGKEAVTKALTHWKVDPDLTSIRDENELAKLPEEERQGWRSLWAEVEALLKRTQGGTS